MKSFIERARAVIEIYPSFVFMIVYVMFIDRELSRFSWQLKQQTNRTWKRRIGDYIG